MLIFTTLKHDVIVLYFSDASVQLTALPRDRLWRIPFYTMDADFPVQYIGCSTLSKATTSGLGSIQKPLREKYVEFRKNSKNKKFSKEATLRVNRDGLTVLFPDAPPGQANQMFYDFSSINLFEAVRFMAMKGSDKKMAAGFVPIDQNRALNNGAENLLSHLEKKHHNLLKMEHPVMLACVMRRTSGVRALECHYFVTETDGQAFRIMSLIRNEHQTRFEREPSFPIRCGEYAPTQPGGPHPDILRNSCPSDYGGMYRSEPAIGPGPGQGRYPPQSDDNYRHHRRSDGWEEPDPRIGDDDSRDDRYIGDARQFYGGAPRDMGPPQHDMTPPSHDMVSPTRQFIYERQSSNDSGQRAYRPDNEYIHDRQRSGEIVRGERYSAEYAQVERYSRPQTRDEGRPARVVSPGRCKEPPSTAPKPTRALSPRRRSPTSPRRQGLPRQPFNSPPSSPRAPPSRVEPRGGKSFYSASSLETRQLEEKKAAKVKPVAKVPPNHMLGVKVLPTGLMAALPKKVEAEPSRFDDDDEDPYDNVISREQFYEKRQNVKSDGDQWDFGHHDDLDKQGPSRYAQPDIVPRQDRDQYGVDYGEMYRKPLVNRPSQHNRHSDTDQNKPWSFDGELQKYSAKQLSDDENSDRGPKGYTHNAPYRKAGETELSDMFTKMNVHRNTNDGIKPSATNFEEQLGYFP